MIILKICVNKNKRECYILCYNAIICIIPNDKECCRYKCIKTMCRLWLIASLSSK